MTRPRARRRLGATTAIVVCALFVFGGRAWAGTTGGITGTVRDATTGEPIGLATVTIPELKRGATTDAQGNYFIINLPAGKYSVRVALLGYVPQVREGVEIFPDFNARIDFSMQPTVLKDVADVEVRGERPLIQKDVTATTKFLAGEEIKSQPLRGYQDAVAQQSGVVNFKRNIDNEAQNNNTLIIRGGRPNEVAYYVDGFSQQDPLTGVSTTSINTDAIHEVVVLAGGFNAEYGRINSGVINVITREGADRYFGSLEAATDNLSGDWIQTPRRDSNQYGFSLGGPLLPTWKKAHFYVSGERRYNQDRDPSGITDEVLDPSQPGLFENGILPSNWSDSWTGVGKVSWRPSPLQTLRIGGTFHHEDWQQYLNAYRFNLPHAPRYEDTNWSLHTTWNHSLSDRTFYELKANYFLTERLRGDGLYFDNLQLYSRPEGNPQYDEMALFFQGDDPATPQNEAHVFDDFLRRKSSYWGLGANWASQVRPTLQLKAGGDFQRHTLRYYNHFFPARLYDENGQPDNVEDVDHYGYDALGNENDEGDQFIDVNGDGGFDAGVDSLLDRNGNGIYDDPKDGAKHPKVGAAYVQGKYERLGLVVNAGLRWDYLTASTQALRSETQPLDPDVDSIPDTRLQDSDLTDSKVYHRISPRLGVGFPVSDRTLVHVNFGKFFQQPNLQDIYVSYAFLEHKLQTGGYFVGFGNPNLEPEETTAYEFGITTTPSDRSRIQLSMYYKDVKNLVEIVNIPSSPYAFASYRNRDFGTIKGIDASYTLRRSGPVAVNAAYSLSWAQGTGSVSQTHRNRAWVGSETPKITTPLDFDQRHKLTLNVDFRYAKGEGPIVKGFRLLENTGINVLLNAASGTPYTPTKIYNEVTLAAVAAEPIGPDNSRYGPWTFTTDFKAVRTIGLGKQALDLYVWVVNLFDRDNVTTVYTSSGNGETTNWLNTNDGRKFLADHGDDGLRYYRLAERNPSLFDQPRVVRLGARLSF